MKEKLLELVKLTEENPDMLVEIMVDGDNNGDGNQYLWHSISRVEVCFWAERNDGTILLDYENYIEYITDEYQTKDISFEDAYEIAENANPENKFEKRIVVFTEAQ